MAEIKYQAKKRFKYGDRVLQPGDEWEPEGGKFDAEIKRTLVRVVEVKPGFALRAEQPAVKKGKEVIRE